MRTLFFLIISFSLILKAQEVEDDSSSNFYAVENKEKPKNLFIGVDLAAPVFGTFTDKQGVKFFSRYRVLDRFEISGGFGIEENTFNQLNWQVNADGNYVFLGGIYFLTQDEMEDKLNGFYAGIHFNYAFYDQHIINAPAYGGNPKKLIDYVGLPKEAVNAYWISFPLGARVSLFKDKLYGDVGVEPMIYVGGKKQNNIDNLVVPGFGRDSANGLNITFNWGISYRVF